MKFDSLATLKKTNADRVARREKQIDLWVSEHGEYDEKGVRASKLILFPFNQASSKDCGAHVAHIYEQLNLDLVIPFGAISGPTLSDIDSKSELAHCIMLTDTYRMLGKITDYQGARNTDTRPCFATLPLSPNHGTMVVCTPKQSWVLKRS
ncbi:hypothetical protein AeNC1_014471 [Aphanomyces euteiches]|nr:hypothetical protein AeNC1_014471 [Aphanomyces euteiches]